MKAWTLLLWKVNAYLGNSTAAISADMRWAVGVCLVQSTTQMQCRPCCRCCPRSCRLSIPCITTLLVALLDQLGCLCTAWRNTCVEDKESMDPPGAHLQITFLILKLTLIPSCWMVLIVIWSLKSQITCSLCKQNISRG